ncbi:PREDICTED: scarecrow-like protein 6 [Ipomoea nil]|uniref:scarecrow-like protein 6 n=1 Tax=Ipomoea nil TaxID=35883 RepID=UPI0009012601|nr:PREDICTED: scarecrow-like protein 6 [Ipomoea nil]
MGGAESELLQPVPVLLEISGGASAVAPEKCVTEEWEQEPEPLLRWITGDADDPSMANLSKLLQGGNQAEYEFNGGLGLPDHNLGADQDSSSGSGFLPTSSFPANLQTPSFLSFLDSSDMKPQISNLQHLQSPSFFMPLPYPYQSESQSLSTPQPAKRHNPGTLGVAETIDHLFKTAELIQTGNSVLSQEILARLNHHLSPIGKPFHRAAFYFKEALQSLLPHATKPTVPSSSPFSLVFKIGAYKSFSEVSPMPQFANFTTNQALLEALEGFDRIHIVDFDIGYGEQWASLMQELALNNGTTPSLKITALASPLKQEQLELGIIRHNLIQFASEINMGFEFETLGVEHLNSSSSWSDSYSEAAIAVNLPVGWLSTNQQVSLPLILSFVKKLQPKIVVSVDTGCDRTDLPFPDHIIHALHSYSNLLESLDAVNMNPDALQKIEKFMIQPGIEKTVTARFDSDSPEKTQTQHWRTVFLSSGFTPFSFSNFAESQAECVLKRTPVGGFHVEKRQSSLVLCWQRKELISASAWRC